MQYVGSAITATAELLDVLSDVLLPYV